MGAILDMFYAALCSHCNQFAMWRNPTIVFPLNGTGPLASQDMPADVRADYDEARQISDLSPRGAAALLRLALQKLCVVLGEPGKNINDDIGSLVKKGLSPQVQQALDSVRIAGNAAVHPGEIDIRDDRETVTKLFKMLNFIVEKTITDPKTISGFYEEMPAGARAAAEARDKRKK